MNYVIYLALVSLLFANSWNMTEVMRNTKFYPPISVEVFARIFQNLYSLPLTSVNVQCIAQDNTEEDRWSIEARLKKIATYLQPQYTQVFFLSGLVLIGLSIGVLIVKLCKQTKQDQPVTEIEINDSS